MPGAGSEPVIAELEEVWTSTIAACSGLTEPEWDLATDCPGWSVRDLLSHLIGIERMLLGEPVPSLVSPVPDHVHNPVGEMNEAWVAERRPRRGADVLAEFEDVTRRRVAELREFSAQQFEEIVPSPIGQVPYGDFMTVRVYDSWVHEQDARLALGRPGGRGSVGEQITLERVTGAMPFVVGRKLKPPEGTTVVWEVSGPIPRFVTVRIEAGRGIQLPGPPPSPSVRIGLEAMTFWRLGCGRVGALEVLSDGSVSLMGDDSLGRRVLEAMNFMF